MDIASVLQRSEKSEKTRAQLESKLKELQDDMGTGFFLSYHKQDNEYRQKYENMQT